MKKILCLLVFILMFFSFNIKGNAAYNGTGATAKYTGGGGKCKSYSKPSTCNNKHFGAVRIRLMYCKGGETGKCKQIGKPYFLVNNKTYLDEIIKNGLKAEYNSHVMTKGPRKGPSVSGNKYNVAYFKQRYSSGKKAKGNVNYILKKMGIRKGNLNKTHQNGTGYNKTGYRLFIEPYMQWKMPKKNGGNLKYYTVKEIFAKFGDTSYPSRIRDHALLLHTSWDDVGIRHKGGITNGKKGTVANPKYGYGYNIINPPVSVFPTPTPTPTPKTPPPPTPTPTPKTPPTPTPNPTCYQIQLQADSPECENDKEQNAGSYTETAEKKDKDSEGEKCTRDATQYGRLVKKVNNCRIYCLENVKVYYPGNVVPSVLAGGHFVWPTFGNNGKYNLDIVGTLNCTSVGKGCKGSIDSSSLYKNFQASASLVFNQDTFYQNKRIPLEKVEKNASCAECGELDTGETSEEDDEENNEETLEGEEIVQEQKLSDKKKLTIVKKVSLKLPDNTYRYVNKKTNISTNIKPANAEYTDIGYGNLPVSLDAKPSIKTNKGVNEEDTDKYTLTLTDIRLGNDNVFGGLANSHKYKCTYKVSNDSPSCKCPPGTKQEGKDLWSLFFSKTGEDDSNETYNPDEITENSDEGTPFEELEEGEEIVDEVDEDPENAVEEPDDGAKQGTIDEEVVVPSNLTCAELIKTQCNKDTPPPDGGPSKECEDEKAKSIETCVVAGNDYNKCVERICENEDLVKDTPKCPEGTPNECMIIKGCVESQLAKGATKNEAFQYCVDTECYGKIPIIYRTISLKNPFPSMTASAGIKGFNKNVNGRYPGANWNSRSLVEAEILENRKVPDDEVYNKDPLYTIELDGNTIKKIREYNSNLQIKQSGGYSDFNLKCTNGSRCISNFLRGSILSGNISGVCAGAAGAEYDTCAEQ